MTTTDDEGSTLTRVYDKVGNVIRTTEVELDVAGYAAGTFHTETFYDALNRPIATVSNLGNTQRFLYDSRDLLVQSSDAMGTATGTISDLPSAGEHGTFPQGGSLAINRRGNTSRFTYDGLGRSLSSIRDLRQDGTGMSVVVGQIATSQTYDDNGRVAQRFDPNGNVTHYAYDHQDRLIREIFADGTEHRRTWNPNGTLALEVDPRGVSRAFTYDALERRSDVAISGRPPGAGQTTFQAFDFDGLGRRTKGEDDDSRVETWFDSMSRAVKETQTVETGAPRTSKGQSFSASVVKDLLRASDGVGNLIKQTYPSGQTFERRYDGVDRLDTLTQGYGAGSSGVVAKLNHAGLGGRRMSRDYWSGGAAVMNQALEYDGDRRVISLEAKVVSGSARIRGFGYAWDRANNRRWERRLSGTYQDEGTGVGEAYRYDSAYRLVHDDKDVGDTALDAIGTNLTSVPAAPFATANASDYVLDAASNRRQTTIAGVTQTYALDASMQTRDLAANQYTFVGNTARSHDLMGNLVGQSDTGRQAFYDADNRLVQWTAGSKDIRYRYDVDGRRTVKEDVGTASFPRTVYFWDGWQTVEETNSAGTVQKRYVWGEGIDEILRATLPDAADINGNANTTEQVDLYYHHNSLGSVVAVTDAAGAVKESYRYSAFGTPTVFNAAGTQVGATVVKQPFMFTGARYDFEEGSGLYQMRHRFYDPVAGRFVSRDPLGLWGDPNQNGNGQGYCGHDPVNGRDAVGLQENGPEPWDPADDVIDYRQLKWEDFKGAVDPKKPTTGAWTAYGWKPERGRVETIELTESKPDIRHMPVPCPERIQEWARVGSIWHAKVRYPDYTLTTKINRTRSWARVGGPLLLKHEQGHADIAEMLGRQAQDSMRKVVGSGSGLTKEEALANAKTDLDLKVDALYALKLWALRRYQDDYDTATHDKWGGIDREAQDQRSEFHKRALNYADGYVVDESLQPRD